MVKRLKLGMGLYIRLFTHLFQLFVSTVLVSTVLVSTVLVSTVLVIRRYRGWDSLWECVIKVSEC